jgi:VanZ family protein
MSLRELRYARLWLAVGRAGIVLIVLLSLLPLPEVPVHVEQGDKLGHLAAYFVLTGWYAQLYGTQRELARRAFGFVLLGGAIELAQALTPYRSAEWLDLVADSAGVALGCALGMTRAARWLQSAERLAPR